MPGKDQIEIEKITQLLQNGKIDESIDWFLTANLSDGLLREVQMYADQHKELLEVVGKPIKVSKDAVICDEYHLGKLLGEGGYGAVFEASGKPDLVVKTEYALRSSE